MLDHEGPTMIRRMRDLAFGVFGHIEITPGMDVYKIIKYIEHILRGAALNKYGHVLVECKELAKGISVYQ